MLGTPDKILEHLLETMRLDSQFSESGSASAATLVMSSISVMLRVSRSALVLPFSASARHSWLFPSMIEPTSQLI